MNIDQLKKEWCQICSKYGFKGNLSKLDNSLNQVSLSIKFSNVKHSHSTITTYYDDFEVFHLNLVYVDSEQSKEFYKPFLSFYKQIMEN